MKENAHSSQYLLMNKDVCILHFFCAHNEFGEVLFAEEEWLVQYRPIGYHGLQDFLEQRRAPKHRAHIRELLEQCGWRYGGISAGHTCSFVTNGIVPTTNHIPLHRERWTVFLRR